jgi:hypothetical protein
MDYVATHKDNSKGSVYGWNALGWMYTGKAGLSGTTDTKLMAFDNGGFVLEDNTHAHATTFTCQVAGVYSVEANLHYTDAGGDYYRLVVAKNGDFEKLNTINSGANDDYINEYMNNGMHAIRGEAPDGNPGFSLAISGFMIMEKGDWANLFFFGTAPYRLADVGGFSMVLVHAL